MRALFTFSLKALGMLLVFVCLTGLTRKASCQTSSQIFTSSGTFIVPAGVTSITVECLGGGGRGGNRTTSGAAAGGGGGGYSRSVKTVVPFTSYTVNVGLGSTSTSAGGNSWFNNSTDVMARGGSSVPDNGASGASGGAVGYGDVTYSGGNGGDVVAGNSGGGGGGAGSSGNGGNASGTTAGTGTSNYGGNGGAGRTNNGDGYDGSQYGGGGGGERRGIGNNDPGNGANGIVVVSWNTVPNSLTYTTSGSFIVLPGVTSIGVECWGGGGRGGSTSGDGAMGGGGGGAYAAKLLTVVPGNSYTVTVGTGSSSSSPGGDSWFQSNNTVMAKGGNSVGTSPTGATGGADVSCYGDVRWSGGNGANGSTQSDYSGGGGSSAGSRGIGNNGSTYNGGTAPFAGGSGGNGRDDSDGAGSPGNTPGGGGGGAYREGSTNYSGGSGANGQVLISWICPEDLSNMATTATHVCAVAASTVTVTSSTLANGTYTVYYDLSGATTLTGQSASMTFTGGTGSFTTINLSTAGVTTITITSVGCAFVVAGQDNTATINVATAAVVADFSASSTTITAGSSINFTDNSSNFPFSWQWEFYGGTPSLSNDQNPSSIVYAAAGYYTVSLTATNSCGSNSLTKYFYITVNNPLTVSQYTSSGVFNVPSCGVRIVRVECWGGGGAGGGTNSSSSRAGGGGSGGTYTLAPSVSVNPGATIAVTVGAGGTGVSGGDGNPGGTSMFFSGIPVIAGGGGGGKVGDNSNNNGAGGGAATGITYNGGTGAAAASGNSGGGGGGAGNAGNGGNASGTAGGSGGDGGGGGGANGISFGSSNGNSATALSGAGGGGRNSSFGSGMKTGGNGYRGQVIVTYTVQAAPDIVLGTMPSITQGTTSAGLPYLAMAGSPDQYSIDYDAAAQTAGFADVTNASLGASPILLTVPGAAPVATYYGTLTVRNSTTTCISSSHNITITVTGGGGCTNPDIPTLSATPNPVCPGSSTSLSIATGNLNSATDWHWYSGSCGGTAEGTGVSINVSPAVTTTYYARGEGGCVTPGSCGSITVTVEDVTPPSVSCKNTSVALDANGQASIVPADVYQSGSDNCGTVNLVSVTPNSFNCNNIGNNPVTLLVNDGNGNTATCSAVVTVADNIPPSPVCKNTTAYLDANGQTSIVPADVYQSGSDNCGTVNLVSVTPNSFNCNNIGNNPVTLLVNDGNGNTATCSAVVTVADNIPPSPVCKNTTAYLDANGQTSIVPADVYQSGSDNCGTVNLVSVTPNSFNCNNIGNNPVTLLVNDGNGNTATCSAVVTVADNIPPSPVCKNTTAYLDANGQASIVPADVYQSGSDNCGTVNLVSVTPNSFTCNNLGNNPVTLLVNDGNGNTATCSATVNVVDQIHPTITCPQGIHVNADPQQCYATVTNLGSPQTDDNCSVANVVNNAPGNNQYPVGTTTVIWTVYDQSGNTATCTQSVTVTDNQPPSITCPPDYYAYADNFVCYALILDLGTPQTNDNCGVANVTNDVVNNGLFPVGNHVVTWTVTDNNGNTATCTQDVIVTDNQPPTIICPQNMTVNTDPGQCVATVSNPGTPGVYDNCGIQSVQNDAPLNGQYAVGVNTVTWYVLDIHGNTTQCSQTITVLDIVSPSITCPQNITVNADAQQCYATIQGLGTPQTSDNCGVQSIINNAPLNGHYPVGNTVVTWTVFDIHGNSSACTQTVAVLDNQPPWVQCPPAVKQCIASGQNGEIVNGLAPLSGDNCGIQSVTYQISGVSGGNGSNDASGTFFHAGQSWVTYTVTDVNGNSATCSVSVELYQRPVASANASPLQLCLGEAFDLLGSGSGGGGGYQYAWTGPNGFSSTDQNPHISNALASHNGLYQLVVTDDHQCSSENDAPVSITVWPLPVVGFSGDPVNICLNCPAITLTGGTPAGGTYGGDGVVNDVFDPILAGPGQHVLTYTYTDGNGCTNSATHNILVTQSLPEEVTVGTGGDYPTLTGNGGLFEAVNNGALWSNLKVYIISDLQEPGTHALNQWVEDGNGPYSMTIVPDLPVLRNITGNVNMELIRFNGADRVTIDGRYDYQDRYLLFRNLAGFNGTIAYLNDACDHTIRACIIEGCNRATNAGVMMIGAGVSTGNNNILITENLFRNANTNNPNNLLSSYSTVIVQNTGIQVINNAFSNFRSNGIFVSGIGSGTSWTVDGNSFFYNMATAATSPQTAISFSPASLSNNNNIRNNLIGGSAAYCGGTAWVNSGAVLFRGIYATAGTYAVENNVISNILMSSTGLGAFNGIDLSVVQGLQSKVKNNTIGSANLPAAVSMAGAGAFTGILINSSLPVQLVEGNTIANIAYTSVGAGSPAIAGIKANKALLRKNRIYELNATGLSLTPTMYGIWFNGAAGASNESSNNMISMGGGAVLNPLIYGIYEGSAANTTAKHYYNTVNIYGTASTTKKSYCFYRQNSVNVTIKNNIFSNLRSASPLGQYAIYTVSGTYWTYCDYNDLYSATAPIAGWVGADKATFALWKTATGKDAHSVNVMPLYFSNTDLHLMPSNTGIDGKGNPIATYTTDIDENIRNVATPDIGCDEFTAVLPRLDDAGPQQAELRVYPNPFTSTTSLDVVLPEDGVVELGVYNLLGERLGEIHQGMMYRGIHTFSFRAEDLPAGMYICRMVIDGRKTMVKRMQLLK